MRGAGDVHRFRDRPMMQLSIETFVEQAPWARAAARALTTDLHAVMARKESVVLAVAGGRTPPPIIDALMAAALPWRRIVAVPTDDRRVAEDHPARNVRALRSWMAPAMEAGARCEALEALAPGSAPDVVLLGFGRDAHIASLFPGGEGMAEALQPDAAETIAYVTPAPPPPEAPFPRVTFTLPALLRAQRIVLAANGPEKLAVLRQAQEPNPKTPLSILLAQRKTSAIAFVQS
jgi:6-phosphogluconolactonase